MNKTYKEMILEKTDLTENQLNDKCPIIEFKNKGNKFTRRIFCDENCEECWDRKPMTDKGIENLQKKWEQH